jgi:hypothetical protein
MTGLLFGPPNMLSVKKPLPVWGVRKTSNGNSLNRATGRYRSPIAGKLRYVCIDPR